MRNIKLVLRYDGTRYSGWQSQEHEDNTIQGKVSAVLSRITREEIRLAGSGRTDAGVHAEGQVANFKTDSWFSCGELLRDLNRYLPEDIAVRGGGGWTFSQQAERGTKNVCLPDLEQSCSQCF